MDGRFYIRQMEWMEMDAQTSISIHSIHLKKCVEWIATLDKWEERLRTGRAVIGGRLARRAVRKKKKA
jgi:hypothetical protein